MSKLSWGKPRIFVKDLDTNDAPWVELNTPVQDSTELQPTKGNKMEAPIEGGENEDVMYQASKYAVVYNIRKLKGRSVPIPHKNGVVSKNYAFMLMPEDGTNIGFYIEKTTVTVDDNFKCAEGAAWNIQHDAIAAASGNTVKWGTVVVAAKTDEGATGHTITFTETQLAEGQTTATTETGNVTVLS